MRTQKSFIIAGMVVLLCFFIAGVADAAPDMSKWEGKWFSYTATVKGIEYDGTSFTKGGNKESGYFKIWNWDGENFQIDTYYVDDGIWNSDARTMEFLAGNDLKFFFLLQNEEDGFSIVAMADGKEKKGVLSSATITSYGGLVVDGDTDVSDFGIGSVSLTAKMIDASKVKVPPAVMLH
jgi:hypothetical protein